MPLLDAATTARVLAGLRAATGAAAPVYGGGAEARVHDLARRTTLLTAPDEIRDLLVVAFKDMMPRLAQHFGRTVSVAEAPQFLRYAPGDYFVAHQDGNTPMLHDDSRFRLISAIAFLNDDYDGGELVFHVGRERERMRAAAGSLVAFPSETTHEVVPVTAGERFTVVTWYR